ncbi:hypothetical protein A9K55_001334 [Cordyceps militaris]|uniref:Pal1-like protein n=1 Tax=Cordyceps militaris TaxID=73501 RepID=A0A2H4SSN6_CORMI|nr:hypothetical protein A9K55_001334 [Cordyceps militaris]
MAATPFRGLNSRLANRSLRIMISPAPATFAERRSILQVLQKYGPVDIFRRENQEAHRYISVTRNEDTAKALAHLSPIACRISLPRIEPAKRARQLQSLAAPPAHPRIEFQTQANRADSARAEEPETEQQPGASDGETTREFVLTIGPARDFDHGKAATRATEHARWPEGYEADQSFAVLALRDTLPDTLQKKGLCYWHVRPAPADAPRDTMRQRLERKQLMPGQMTAAAGDPVNLPPPRPRRRW